MGVVTMENGATVGQLERVCFGIAMGESMLDSEEFITETFRLLA